MCVLAHWAALGGMKGDIAKYALPPGQSSGNYQKHLDAVMNLKSKDDEHYIVDLPMYDKCKGHRVIRAIPMQSPLEALVGEVRNSNATFDALESGPAGVGEEATESYNSHPLIVGKTLEERKRIVCYAMYVDGVPFSLRRVGYDSVLGIWLVNLHTMRRHLLIAMRKVTCANVAAMGGAP